MNCSTESKGKKNIDQCFVQCAKRCAMNDFGVIKFLIFSLFLRHLGLDRAGCVFGQLSCEGQGRSLGSLCQWLCRVFWLEGNQVRRVGTGSGPWCWPGCRHCCRVGGWGELRGLFRSCEAGQARDRLELGIL